MRNPTSRALPTLLLATAVSSCVTESAEPPALRETLPNGALLVRYPDLPATDAVGPDVTEAHVDLQFGSLDGDDPNLLFGDIRGIQATSHDHGKWRILGVDLAGEQVRRFNKPVLSYGAIWDGVFDDRGRYWREDSHSDEDMTYPPPPGWSSSTWHDYYKSYDLSSGAVDSVYLGERSYRSFYAHYRDSNGRLQWLTPGFRGYEGTVVNPSGGFWHANSATYRIARTGEEGDTLVVIEAGVPSAASNSRPMLVRPVVICSFPPS